MAPYNQKYRQLFDYLSADEVSPEPNGLVVFGRKDLLIAHKALDIIKADGAPWAIISGGVGKDSGDLKIPEAEYLANEIYRAHHAHADTTRAPGGQTVDSPPIYLDTEATNGGENTRNSLAIVAAKNLNFDNGITTVAHATSSRRLAEMMKHTAAKQEVKVSVFRQASDYQFDPSNPADQKEAHAEMSRLLDWPAKDWLLPQHDLPENLVDFVRDPQSHKE